MPDGLTIEGTGNREQGNREQGTGNRGKGTGEQGTGGREQGTGNRTGEMSRSCPSRTRSAK
ncbi:MAG: hypothetical protein EBE86_018150 [Hormoscilla sp. GUM202]|nr:hypothetical protein [Hormoscilla sp. GUM202]